MNGYHGRFLKIDLQNRATEEIPLVEEDRKQFIGGAGLSAKIMYDHIKEGMDPLSAESPLVFSTGPFTGTAVPMVSRYAVCGVSPLTGYWGEATSGGRFPFMLKGSGYDGIFVTGKSEKPLYLSIKKDAIEFKDASDIWGKDSYETQEQVLAAEGNSSASMVCIAQAGEKVLKYACIINDKGRVSGRCGLGALMGSKNLKAIVASGNARPSIADPDGIKKLIEKARTKLGYDVGAKGMSEYGTNSWMDMGMMMADVPAKYFTKSVFPAERLDGKAFREAYSIGRYACLGCPVGCGREIKRFGPEQISVDGPEYETVGAFGPLCMNFDLDPIIEANHLCNVYGIDTISTGVSIAYAMYLAEQGVLTKEKAGMDIKWGDGETIVKLVKMIINQEGIGKLLAQGTLAMARELGRDEGEAAQVKGMEMPMHDARAFHGQALMYATGSRGACHLRGDYYSIDVAGKIREYDVYADDRFTAEGGKAVMAAKVQAFKEIFDSLTLCKFSPLTPTILGGILTAITGWEYTPQDLLTVGERTINIKRAISLKLGLTREEDKIPDICARKLDEGSSAGTTPDMETLLRDYYDYRQWDWETGKPKEEKLIELGLEQAAHDLYGK